MAAGALALAAAVTAPAAEPAIIAKARAFVGAEAVLNELRVVRYTGTVLSVDSGNPTKPTQVAIDIVFQKPDQQWVMAKSADAVEITVLDGYQGWKRLESTKDTKQFRQSALGLEAIRRMRATTWGNLAFWRGLEAQGGRVEEQGTQVVDGTTCQKIAFIHQPGIIYYRYFDVATGRLVLTETEAGEKIREEGEMNVNGIRFPRRVLTESKTARGNVVTVTMTFDLVTTNEPLPAAQFQAPLMKAR